MKKNILKLLQLFIQEHPNKPFYSENLSQRILVVIIIFSLAFTLVATKLTKVSLQGKLTNNASRLTIPHISRNEIVDRNGILLAVDLDIVSLYANPSLLFNPTHTANKLCEIFPDLKKDTLTKTLKSKKTFAWIKRNITPRQQHQVNSLGVPGLEFEKGHKRVYTQGNLLSHVLGYVDTDGLGIAGIEKQFDQVLRDKKNGKLQLSIDVRVQNIVHDEMLKSIKEFKAKGGIGIVMDAHNGEIVSMVSLPDFDPHKPNLATPESLFNQASLGSYEFGSIMKSFTFAMVVETKAVSLNQVYYVKEPLKAARFLIHDYRPKYSHLSVPEIFMYSSNIGTAMLSLEVGGKRQRQFLKKFGFFDPVNIELPEKGQPLYPSERNWSDISTMTISFGHGMAITPIQFIRGGVSLVNGGYLCEPTLFKVSTQTPQIHTQVLSKETSEIMRQLMRLVVEHGSGKKANAAGYLVGGKTGSAEKAKRSGYSKSEKFSSFFAAFPINNPRYVILTTLDDPKPNSETKFTGGAWSAAPLSGRIISRIAPLLNVKPVDSEAAEIKNQLWLDFKPEEDIIEESF